MPYLRRLPKVPPNGRIAVKLVPEQRDQLLTTGLLPQKLAHALHHARVARGKLELRVTASELDALIAAAIKVPPSGRAEERTMQAFIGYLETLSDRFAEPSGD